MGHLARRRWSVAGHSTGRRNYSVRSGVSQGEGIPCGVFACRRPLPIPGHQETDLTLTLTARLEFIDSHAERLQADLAEVVAEGLSRPQKSLACRFFYDSYGSELFEQITDLPEYYLT